MYYCDWQFLYALLQLTTFVCTIAVPKYSLLQKKTSRSLVTLFIKTFRILKQHNRVYKTCYRRILWLVELLSQLKMQNLTMKCSNIINHNNSNNIYTLTTAKHYHKTRCRHTDRQTDRLTDWPTDRPTDIVTYKAAIAAENSSIQK